MKEKCITCNLICQQCDHLTHQGTRPIPYQQYQQSSIMEMIELMNSFEIFLEQYHDKIYANSWSEYQDILKVFKEINKGREDLTKYKVDILSDISLNK